MKRALCALLGLLLLTATARADAPRGLETRLVRIRLAGLFFEAEIPPDLDYTVSHSYRYRVEGDPVLLSRLGSGLTVRVRGEFRSDVLRLQETTIGASPPLQPLAGSTEAWRGRLRARTVSVDPPEVELELGPGQVRRARLDLTGGDEDMQWAAWREKPAYMVEGNVIVDNGLTVVHDVRFGEPPLERLTAGPVRLVGQLSEGFLDECLQRFLLAHQGQFRWSAQGDQARFEVRRMGATLLNCQPGEVRFYGTLGGTVVFQGQTVPVVEGEFEVVGRPRFDSGKLRLELTPGSLEVRLTRPFNIPVPRDWSAAGQDMLRAQLASGLSIPIPGAYAPGLEASGILAPADLGRLAVWTVPTGDRRTGLLVVAGPVAPGAPGPNLVENRLTPGGEFALALSPEAVNAALARNLPGLLPIKRTIPPELRPSEQVFIFSLEVTDVEVTKLDLGYRPDGLFDIKDCVVEVHWKLAGIFGGDEPGARLTGTAAIQSVPPGQPQGPLALKIKPDITKIEFLSPHILERSAQEQEAIRAKVQQGLATLQLDFLLPSRMPVADLSGTLELVDVTTPPGELRLQGRLVSP